MGYNSIDNNYQLVYSEINNDNMLFE